MLNLAAVICVALLGCQSTRGAENSPPDRTIDIDQHTSDSGTVTDTLDTGVETDLGSVSDVSTVLDGDVADTEAGVDTAGAADAVGADTAALSDAEPTDTSVPDVSSGNVAPSWNLPAAVTLDENELFELNLDVSDPDGEPVSISVWGLPPGATVDLAERRLVFRPDFIQGGQSWTVMFEATDGTATTAWSLTIAVQDTITPPLPSVVNVTPDAGFERREVTQVTDAFLDSPGYAGRAFNAVVSVPVSASTSTPVPVHIALHGFGGNPGAMGSATEIQIRPHDPHSTYWWGYASGQPGSTSGVVADYTLRRVLHLLSWGLQTIPGADPERVYITGGSMGGAGALLAGLRYARHFAYVEGTIGQTIARNHRPSRLAQLSTHWGSPELDLAGPTTDELAWDAQDLTHVLATSPEARQQFVFTYHGKDDPIIHFGAAVTASPKTGQSWLAAVQSWQVGHYAVWDEGGHGPSDPVMGNFWSDWNWNRIHHNTTYLRRDRAFVAFTQCTGDRTPGSTGNGTVPFNAESGYAADVAVAGDTGWDGDIAGAFNRFLRWDTASVVDTPKSFEVLVWFIDEDGSPPPQPGYPSVGNQYSGPLPLNVNATPRRTQAFRCEFGEPIQWQFGAEQGEVACGVDGVPTAPQISLTSNPTILRFTRP